MDFMVVANWKMNKSPKETEKFFSDFFKKDLPSHFKIIFFVPSVNAQATACCFNLYKKRFSWGPQNIYHKGSGAFTGETSPQVMKELGSEFVLVGHSERRQLFNETDGEVNLKVQAGLDFGMTPIVCIGESLEEREKGFTKKTLEKQLERGLEKIKLQRGENQCLHIAYEPLWAIGTGKVASVEQVDETHGLIRAFLKKRFGPDHERMGILYGGSVKAGNARSLYKLNQVGGLLVGGASLESNSFSEIINSIQTRSV